MQCDGSHERCTYTRTLEQHKETDVTRDVQGSRCVGPGEQRKPRDMASPLLTPPQTRRGHEQLCVDVTIGLRAEIVYGGDFQSISTDHCSPTSSLPTLSLSRHRAFRERDAMFVMDISCPCLRSAVRPIFQYFLERQSESDSKDHGLLAVRLVEALCGTDANDDQTKRNWEAATAAANAALDNRFELWEAVRGAHFVHCAQQRLERFYAANTHIKASHGLSHALAVYTHAVRAVACCAPPLPAMEEADILLAALLHDVDDRKYFPDDAGQFRNARCPINADHPLHTRYCRLPYASPFWNIGVGGWVGWQVVDGLRTEVCGQQKQSTNPCNNQHNPQYANYWAPLARKRHIPPHPAQPRHTNDWAPRTRKRHQQEHRPQRPTEHSNPTQHAKGRAGDCPGPHKETTTRRNVTQGDVVNRVAGVRSGLHCEQPHDP